MIDLKNIFWVLCTLVFLSSEAQQNTILFYSEEGKPIEGVSVVFSHIQREEMLLLYLVCPISLEQLMFLPLFHTECRQYSWEENP